MAITTEVWLRGAMYEIRWMFEDDRWDPRAFVLGLPLTVQVRLQRSAQRFADVGRLNGKLGHWRQGKSPRNEIYEFKDLRSGVRLLSFSARSPDSENWFMVAFGTIKDSDDITRQEEERAILKRARYLEACPPPTPPKAQTQTNKKRR